MIVLYKGIAFNLVFNSGCNVLEVIVGILVMHVERERQELCVAYSENYKVTNDDDGTI